MGLHYVTSSSDTSVFLETIFADSRITQFGLIQYILRKPTAESTN